MKTFTKRLLAAFGLVMISAMMYAQMPDAISISPESATADDQITLTLTVSKACVPTGKNAVSSRVCMHAGYGELSDPNSWQNVIDWDKQGKDSTKTELTDNGDGTFSITFTPKSYFGIDDGVIVSQINAVFNGCDAWASEAKDNDGSGGCMDFFIPIKYKSTKPSIGFKLNMNKMLADGNFDPSYKVYVKVDGFTEGLMLDVDGSGNTDGIYEYVFEDDNLQDSTKYNYEFYFEDLTATKTYETLGKRSIDVAPGKNIVDVWWNDEPQAITTFQLDMSAQIADTNFNPASDFIDIAGSFNGWDGKDHHLTKVGEGLYEVSIALEPGKTYEYKYRINGDWNNSEFANGGANRKHVGTYKSYTVWNLYDNWDPSKWTVELQCDMHYQISAGHYDAAMQFLDVAGNFEGWNGGIVLGDFDNDSIYTALAFVDTASTTMEFKFRMDGDWNTSEFPGGGPNRKWTPDSNMSVFYAWYNDADPNVAAKPVAYDVKITGEARVGETLTGSYTYEDVNGDAEATSVYQWIRADDAMGTNMAPIAGANTTTYTLTDDDNGKYVAFAVQPVAANQDTGSLNYAFVGPVVASGVKDDAFKNVVIYPNPTSDVLNLENVSKIESIEIYSSVGTLVRSIPNNSDNNILINTSDIKNGIYFVIFRSHQSTFTYRLVKR